MASAKTGNSVENLGLHGFQVGDIRCHAIHAGMMDTELVQPFFGPDVDPEVFAAQTRRFTRNGWICMPFNVLLLEVGHDLVLVDAGPGTGRHCRVIRALRRLGFDAGDISLVILTHAHFDHQGGLLDEERRPVFTKARHVAMRAEHDFWMSKDPDLRGLRLPPEVLLKPAREVFGRITFELLEPGDSPLKGLECHAAPGHTPGHMTLSIRDGGEELYHIADLCHHSPSLLRNPHLSPGSDVDGRQAIQSRMRILAELAAKQTRSFGYHMPYPGVGYLVREATGYSWMAEDYRCS